VRFAVRDVHILLWGVCEFRENRLGGAGSVGGGCRTILTDLNKMPFIRVPSKHYDIQKVKNAT
jgi:hypothetical protein